MSLSIEGQVGPRASADGSKTELRLDRTAALVVTPGHARFREAAGRGALFTATTGTPGVAPGTALTTSPPFCIWNPAGSSVSLSIVRVRLAYVSGTLGSGLLTYSYVAGQAQKPAGGTAIPAQSTRLTASTGIGQAYQGATLTSAPVMLMPAGTIQPVSAATATMPLVICEDDIDGEIEIAPGNALCLQAVGAAGTSPLVVFSVTWEEVPV